MAELEQSDIDKLLIQLEEGDYLRCRLNFSKDGQSPVHIGKGGFSDVYEMYDREAPGIRYAVKIMGIDHKLVTYERLLETVRLQSQLTEQSKNIVRLFRSQEIKVHLDRDANVQSVVYPEEKEYGMDDGMRLQFVWMELLEEILRKNKFGNISLLREQLKSEEEILKFAEQIGNAILTAHNNNILHRDIKLENIFWDQKEEQYKLGDFGFAKYVEDGNAETILYTNGYGAPEIEKRLVNNYNAAADIYSFGITLYLLLNDLKFPASSGYYANPVQYSEEFIIPAPIHASEALTRIVRKMCSYHIRDRYQSMEEVMTDIRRIRGTVPEENDAECLEDLATATYRETDESKWEKDPGTGPENTEGRGKESREKRKEQKKEQERIFAEANAFAFFRFAILFFALFKIYVVKSEHLMMWQWWMLLAAVLIEGIFLTVKEFHVIFGILTIAISGYFLCTQTAGPGPLFLMLTVLIGIPSLTVGCAAGGILSSLQLLTGEFAWTNILTRWKIGWIVVVILSAAIEKSVFFNYRFDKISEERAKILLTLIDRIALYLTIAGLVLQFIRTFKILEISESLQNIRIARTGIGMLITHFLIMESEKQNEVENGSMDEE